MWTLASRSRPTRNSVKTAALVLAASFTALSPAAHANPRDPVVAGVIGAGTGALIGSALGGRDGAVIGAVIGGVAGANLGYQARLVYPGYYAYPQREVREIVYTRPYPQPHWREMEDRRQWQDEAWDRRGHRSNEWDRDREEHHHHDHGNHRGHD
jgi:hypothetical protein